MNYRYHQVSLIMFSTLLSKIHCLVNFFLIFDFSILTLEYFQFFGFDVNSSYWIPSNILCRSRVTGSQPNATPWFWRKRRRWNPLINFSRRCAFYTSLQSSSRFAFVYLYGRGIVTACGGVSLWRACRVSLFSLIRRGLKKCSYVCLLFLLLFYSNLLNFFFIVFSI